MPAIWLDTTFDRDPDLYDLPPTIKFCWVLLLCTDAEHGLGGILEPRHANPAWLSGLWGVKPTAVREALTAFEDRGLLTWEGGGLKIKAASQPASPRSRPKDLTSAERQRRWRDRQRSAEAGSFPVTETVTPVTPVTDRNDRYVTLRNGSNDRYVTEEPTSRALVPDSPACDAPEPTRGDRSSPRSEIDPSDRISGAFSESPMQTELGSGPPLTPPPAVRPSAGTRPAGYRGIHPSEIEPIHGDLHTARTLWELRFTQAIARGSVGYEVLDLAAWVAQQAALHPEIDLAECVKEADAWLVTEGTERSKPLKFLAGWFKRAASSLANGHDAPRRQPDPEPNPEPRPPRKWLIPPITLDTPAWPAIDSPEREKERNTYDS